MTDAPMDPQDATVLADRDVYDVRRSGWAEQDGRIRVVTSRVQLALLIGAPVATAWVLVLFARDPMFASGLAAVIAVFVVFQVFASRIPDAFERLRSRRVIDDLNLASFTDFKTGTERALNSPKAVVVGVAFAFLDLARFPVQAGGISQFGDHLLQNLRTGQPLVLLDVLAEATLAFILGFVAWRMLVIAVRIIKLGRVFRLRLQIGHPDGCGGFRPIGDLCLWNALLLTVPAVFLGFWLPLAPEFGYGNTYEGLHTAMLGLLVGLAIVMFVAPLWSIHLSMRRDAERIREEIDQLGHRIDKLSRELIRRAEELTPDESKDMASELEAHQAVYRRNEHVPTWAINLPIALKFGSAQVVPLLGLTGLGEPIIDLVASIVGSLEPG